MNILGILTYDAGISVVTSYFENNEYGIENYATYPLSTNLDIGSGNPVYGNSFGKNNVGVYSTATTNLFVRNNAFFDYGLAGVAVNGNSQYFIRNNTFNTPGQPKVVAIDLDHTGTKFNEIRCNLHFTNYWSIDFRGTKSGTNFYDQNFNGIYDIWLTNYYSTAGEIAHQGDIVDARYNYFTVVSGNLQHINTTGITNTFRYWHPNVSPGSPLIPKCSFNNPAPCISGNNFITNSASYGVTNCPPEGGGGGPRNGQDDDQFDDCITVQCLNDLDDHISSIDPEGLSEEELSIYEGMLTQRNRVFWKLINLLIQEENYAEAEDLLLNENNEIAKMNLFGIKMLQKDYSAAESVLETLNLTGEDNTFKDVQYINLRRFSTETEFNITDAEVAFLQTVALSDGSGAGYARGLLSLTRGITYDPELPELQQEQAIPEFITSIPGVDTHDITIYPNPASEQVNIQINTMLEGQYSFTIYNTLGAQVYHKETVESTNFVLNTSLFGKGMFFGILRNNGKDAGVVKFVVQ